MTVLLTILAIARVTRFITVDALFDGVRNRTVVRLTAEGKLRRLRADIAYLIMCTWCASVYVGAAAAGAWYAWGETLWFTAVTLALTASYVAGFLATITDRGE